MFVCPPAIAALSQSRAKLQSQLQPSMSACQLLGDSKRSSSGLLGQQSSADMSKAVALSLVQPSVTLDELHGQHDEWWCPAQSNRGSAAVWMPPDDPPGLQLLQSKCTDTDPMVGLLHRAAPTELLS